MLLFSLYRICKIQPENKNTIVHAKWREFFEFIRVKGFAEPSIMNKQYTNYFTLFFMNELKNIHIGTIIKQKLKETSITIADFGRKIHLDRTTVYGIFERKSIDSVLLYIISETLNFDFYNEVYLNRKTNNFPPKIFISV